jgi:hypothetical protein
MAEYEAVAAARARHPRWARDKLVRVLARGGISISTARVGRILTRLAQTGELHEPACRISVRKRSWRRPNAVRKPADYRIERPGDLVELDTLDVRHCRSTPTNSSPPATE